MVQLLKVGRSYLKGIIKNTQEIILVQVSVLLLEAGDIETNPGLVNINISHLNSLWVDNFIKLSLLEAYLSVYKFDIVCLSETFLNSSIADNDLRLILNGYDLLRSDNPSDSKKGGVCIYYKNHLRLTRKSNLTKLDECIVCELKASNKRCLITVLYNSHVINTGHTKKNNNGIPGSILLHIERLQQFKRR